MLCKARESFANLVTLLGNGVGDVQWHASSREAIRLRYASIAPGSRAVQLALLVLVQAVQHMQVQWWKRFTRWSANKAKYYVVIQNKVYRKALLDQQHCP